VSIDLFEIFLQERAALAISLLIQRYRAVLTARPAVTGNELNYKLHGIIRDCAYHYRSLNASLRTASPNVTDCIEHALEVILVLQLNGVIEMRQDPTVAGVKKWAEWWLEQRLGKIRKERHDSMEVNPFMAPLISALHGHSDFLELADFLLGGHFAIGHATGFGKLIDEKILPNVFATTKLDKATRRGSKLFKLACFDNIDHIVHKNGEDVLLSLKASKWTIQLGQAVELNKSFKLIHELLENREHTHSKVVVGVFYGNPASLTDKYRLVRGISGEVDHDVHDIQNYVDVLAGQEFWSWLGDHPDTQLWVMQGIEQAIDSKKKELQEAQKLMTDFRNSFARRYENFIDSQGNIDWIRILQATNG